MRKLVALALVIFLWLQYALWFGQSGHFAQLRLTDELDQHKQRVAVLQQRNRILTAQVLALRADAGALEAHARRDLGLVKKGEVFFFISDSAL